MELFINLKEENVDTKTLKSDLSARVGLTSDPLASARRFNDRKQEPGEVSDYARDFKRLYSQAYPREDAQSIVLVHCFLTGLRVPK